MSNATIDKGADMANTIKCKNCSANLKYKPGTKSLKCDYCNTNNDIESSETTVIENDYLQFLKENGSAGVKQDITVCKCTNCGASTTLPPNITSSACPYCDTPLVVQNASTCSIIKPKYVLAFKIDRNEAKEKFISWVKSLWFAPNKLKDYAAHSAEKLNGVYMPYWTYDSNTVTSYIGMRGVHYYVTETYRDSNGKTQTRSVRHTRWTPVSGTVNENFNDVLVCASNSLPRDLTKKLEPWDLQELAEFDDRYLAGFITESYQVNITEGFDHAKNTMAASIRGSIRSDIGGDEQQITSMDTNYNDITFKHILLPLWISAYSYDQKTYRFSVNARTGEVQGERPYSAWKIFFLVITILAIIGTIIYLSQRTNYPSDY
ncbi:MAG: zinc finger domain-containing protein [Sphingobacteriaceae bacterium]